MGLTGRMRVRKAVRELTATPEQKVARAKCGIFWRIVCIIILVGLSLIGSWIFMGFWGGTFFCLAAYLLNRFFRSASK